MISLKREDPQVSYIPNCKNITLWHPQFQIFEMHLFFTNMLKTDTNLSIFHMLDRKKIWFHLIK